MKPIKLIVKTKGHKYPIIIGSNLFLKLEELIKNNSIQYNKILFVVDKNIPKKFISQIKNSFKGKKIYFHFIKTNEKNKNQNVINNILDTLLNANFSRQDCLIAIGGGITGDVGGFAASIFKRGLQFINIPTTLLSQVDSSVGGKTAVNHPLGITRDVLDAATKSDENGLPHWLS